MPGAVLGRALGRARHQGERDPEFGGTGQRAAQDSGEHPGVVQGVVRPPLPDAVVGGQCAQPHVGSGRSDPPVQCQRAQPPLDRQPQTGPGEFTRQEVVVERRVVRDHHPAFEHRRDPLGDLVERRGTPQPLGGQPVDVHRAGVAAGVEQCGELLDGLAVRPEREHRQRQHTVLGGPQAGRLDVHERPVVGVGERPGHVPDGGELGHGGKDARTVRRYGWEQGHSFTLPRPREDGRDLQRLPLGLTRRRRLAGFPGFLDAVTNGRRTAATAAPLFTSVNRSVRACRRIRWPSHRLGWTRRSMGREKSSCSGAVSAQHEIPDAGSGRSGDRFGRACRNGPTSGAERWSDVPPRFSPLLGRLPG
ncbi:hypothetical protein SAMN04489712_101529 [Thermomonospora echinospora]|uniref:Uncharacterized protein n=1 Tax=Thermomonospora echinospora TaxID=1992 RepID=A0A1H5TBC6_9ACTN|nr:hypothetical protein SAMN04489712_101529 [Thermomonospora echinospora]